MPEENKIECERYILKRVLERMSVLVEFSCLLNNSHIHIPELVCLVQLPN